MQYLNKHLYQNGVFFALGFFVLALWAFWPSYYSHLNNLEEPGLHFHGLAMTTWCLLLIAQAFLIRVKKYALHRFVGKVSYVVFPFIVVATLNLIHYRFQGVQQLAGIHLSNIALMVNATLLLAILYGMAIYYRKQPLTHARYMICTIFPMVTPVTDRLIHHHFRSLLAYVPRIEGYAIAPAAGFLLADVLVLGLLIWDWRTHKRLDVFPVVLVLLLLYHASVLYFYQFSFWRSFSQWFLSLPLS